MAYLRTSAALTLFVCLAGATPASADAVTHWNQFALTVIPPGRPGTGPAGILDLAMVQAAVHDAVQAYEKRFQPYAISIAGAAGSPEAAVATAARDVLVARLPAAQDALVEAEYLDFLQDNGLEGNAGIQVGSQAAAAVIALRANDGSFPTMCGPGVPPPCFPQFTGGTAAGQWRPTPTANLPMAAPWLGDVTPYAIRDPLDFQPGPIPALSSAEYAEAYNEVKSLGAVNSTRTARQNHLVRFYGDFLGQWNALLRTIGNLSRGERARLLALANIAAADSAIVAWRCKFDFNFWRPITAIRLGDTDGNPATDPDTGWTPFLATPPYPDYTSGANNLGGSISRILALFFGTDHMTFNMTTANTALPPAQRTLTYHKFSDVAKDIVDVRIWQGIHFRFADTEARTQGRRVANHVFKNFLQPIEN